MKTLINNKKWLKTQKIFKSNLKYSIIMSLILLIITIINLTDLIPHSDNRPFRNEFSWILSIFSLSLSFLFAYWSISAFLKKNE